MVVGSKDQKIGLMRDGVRSSESVLGWRNGVVLCRRERVISFDGSKEESVGIVQVLNAIRCGNIRKNLIVSFGLNLVKYGQRRPNLADISMLPNVTKSDGPFKKNTEVANINSPP